MAKACELCVLLALLTSSALLVASSQKNEPSLDNPLLLLKTLATLPPAQQELLLIVVGSSLQARTGMDCNIFAGTASCKRLPSNSSYLQQCPSADPKVDCIFAKQVTENIYDNPVDDLYNLLSKEEHLDIQRTCPQCFDNVQAMWCALAAPRCGSFKRYIQVALLPILSDVSEALSALSLEGVDTNILSDALSGAAHAVLDAAAVGLPCREMCQATVDTCDCAGRNETVGSLMEWMEAQEKPLAGQVSHTLNKMLFQRVWDRPFCDMFLPYDPSKKNAGSCVHMAPACADRVGWCQATGPGKADAFRRIQAALVVQLTKAVTGWLEDARYGLLRTHDAITKTGDDKELDALKDKYVAHVTLVPDGPPEVTTPTGLVVFFSLCGVAIVATVIGTLMWQWLKLRRADRGYVELQQSDNYDVIKDVA